jgi:succinylglutamate desuccinylase
MPLPSHVYFFSGQKHGPTVVIMGAVHGDEKIGAMVVDKLQKELSQENIHGEIYLIVGNPKAYQKNVRYIDCDLNRLYGEKYAEIQNMDQNKLNYEERRILEIAPILKKADYLVDIHSTVIPSVAFSYTEYNEEHLNLACLFGTEYIVSAHLDFRIEDLVSASDNFVDNYGGIGITYESGWYRDLTSANQILNNVKRFLRTLGVSFFDVDPLLAQDTKHIIIYSHILSKTDNFSFIENFSNLCPVTGGDLIAYDGDEKIYAPRDSFIIFPKKTIGENSIVGYLGYFSKYVTYR